MENKPGNSKEKPINEKKNGGNENNENNSNKLELDKDTDKELMGSNEEEELKKLEEKGFEKY